MILLVAAVLLPSADQARGHDGDDPVPSLQAERIEETIRLDGVLDEGAWGRAQPATGFTQREPRSGEPATETTFIRILFDDKTLYVGIDARHANPERIVALEMGRDVSLFRDDSVVVLLDTFHDHRNAYFFETNPNSSRTDALITDEGRDTNFEWDGVWKVRSRRTESGWSAEMAIPF
ncbi:MAG: carbohydrate binding family 9 domain-containing protein, partial [Acidobacteriota bacterium]